jgi:flagellar basal-body rod protein FlgB
MIGSLLNDPRINMLQQALGGLAQRQQALAGNIANVDTPGYKRRDVPFESELRASLGTAGGARMATTSAGHIVRAPASQSLLAAAGGQGADRGRSSSGRNDGNDVDIDYEMTQLAETSLRYQLLTQATSSRFAMLRDIVARAA